MNTHKFFENNEFVHAQTCVMDRIYAIMILIGVPVEHSAFVELIEVEGIVENPATYLRCMYEANQLQRHSRSKDGLIYYTVPDNRAEDMLKANSYLTVMREKIHGKVDWSTTHHCNLLPFAHIVPFGWGVPSLIEHPILRCIQPCFRLQAVADANPDTWVAALANMLDESETRDLVSRGFFGDALNNLLSGVVSGTDAQYATELVKYYRKSVTPTPSLKQRREALLAELVEIQIALDKGEN